MTFQKSEHHPILQLFILGGGYSRTLQKSKFHAILQPFIFGWGGYSVHLISEVITTFHFQGGIMQLKPEIPTSLAIFISSGRGYPVQLKPEVSTPLTIFNFCGRIGYSMDFEPKLQPLQAALHHSSPSHTMYVIVPINLILYS